MYVYLGFSSVYLIIKTFTPIIPFCAVNRPSHASSASAEAFSDNRQLNTWIFQIGVTQCMHDLTELQIQAISGKWNGQGREETVWIIQIYVTLLFVGGEAELCTWIFFFFHIWFCLDFSFGVFRNHNLFQWSWPWVAGKEDKGEPLPLPRV